MANKNVDGDNTNYFFGNDFQARGPNVDGKKIFIRFLHVNAIDRRNQKQSSCTRLGPVQQTYKK